MPSVRLEEVQGRTYFRCQHTGALCSGRYGIPTKSGKNRIGCFADAAVAVAWVLYTFALGEIKEKKKDKLIELIAGDLHIRKDKVLSAPAEALDPLAPNFSYRSKPEFKKMLKEQKLITVEEELLARTRAEAAKSSGPSSASASGPLFYTVLPDHAQLGESVVPADDQVMFGRAKEFNKITSAELAGKKCLIIHGDSGANNAVMNAAFPAISADSQFKGPCYIHSSRKLHKEEKPAAPASKKRKAVAADEQAAGQPQ